MPNKKILILNFDDSITQQEGFLSHYEASMIGLRDLGPRARFWMKCNDRCEIERRIPAQAGNAVIAFLGSGDFHHITNILINRFDEPISIIDFDFHPDWNCLSPWLHCGTWARDVMKSKKVLKLVMIGASSRDLSTLSLQSGDLGSLRGDRVEVYPYSCKPGAVFFRTVPPNVSLEIKRYPFFTRIYWNELKDKNINEFLPHIIRRLPTRKVYVTVDKDCLGPDDALTNWDQGSLPLNDLLTMLKIIKENLDIVGMDIVGDYSPIRVEGVFKNVASWLDHPKNIVAATLPESFVTAVNERTNLKILDVMT